MDVERAYDEVADLIGYWVGKAAAMGLDPDDAREVVDGAVISAARTHNGKSSIRTWFTYRARYDILNRYAKQRNDLRRRVVDSTERLAEVACEDWGLRRLELVERLSDDAVEAVEIALSVGGIARQARREVRRRLRDAGWSPAKVRAVFKEVRCALAE